MCAKRIKFLMTRLSVCSLGVSCNEMIDTPMLLVVREHSIFLKKKISSPVTVRRIIFVLRILYIRTRKNFSSCLLLHFDEFIR